MTRISLIGRLALLPPLLAAGAGRGALRAQAFPDTLAFERVGDRPLDADGLDFDDAGVLWAAEPVLTLWRLPPGSAVWEEVYDGIDFPGENILALSPDTLLASRAGRRTSRSVDGGQSWTQVFHAGGALFEPDPDGPNAGRLVVGADTAGYDASYSLDRGATWAYAALVGTPSVWWYDALAFAELIEAGPVVGGGPLWPAGRLIAAARGGMMYSDDGGETWRPSELWSWTNGVYGYSVVRVAEGVLGVPAGRLVAQVGDLVGQLRTSDDGGETWTYRATLPTEAMLVALPGPGEEPSGDGSVLAVGAYLGASVWRSADGGETWEMLAGPIIAGVNGANAALIGPDGRLYVAVSVAGTAEEWVYRSVEAVVSVAQEPGLEAPPEPLSLEVYPNPARGTATVSFTLRASSEVEAVLYDVLGRQAAVLVSGPLDAGRHEVRLEGAGLPAGVYVVRAVIEEAPGNGTRVLTKRVTLMR
jgi:hypothetical protein